MQTAIYLMELQVALSSNLRESILVGHDFNVASRLRHLGILYSVVCPLVFLCCSFIVVGCGFYFN